MKKIFIISIFSVVMIGLLLGCSENKNPLPSKSHPESWMQKNSENFHGNKVKVVGYSYCANCHGKDYRGGESKVSCYKCHQDYPHLQILNTSPEPGAIYHAEFLNDESLDITPCQACHGTDYQGGSSGVSCYKCHESFPHVESWLISDNEQFHGQYLKSQSWSLTGCLGCHGMDFKGGKSKVSCFACHNAYPHIEGWLESSSEAFHGEFLANTDWNLEMCSNCHGSDFKGGTNDVSCFTCHASYPHSGEWLTTTSDEFHGQYLKNANWSSTQCQVCHGSDYKGGESKVSCYTCHAPYPHAEGWLAVADTNFHGQFIRASNWSLAACQRCHGEDYRGGIANYSCYNCHTSEGGPEACNTCHGSQANAAPPEDLNNNTETTAIGVGAHQLHYTLFQSCQICHVQPTAVSDPGHIDDTPYAEVNASWSWDRNTATCVTVCHSDTTKTYIWNNF